MEGFDVVNGLAVGCDTAALRGALSEGGRCVAVLPCGLDMVVPSVNEYLAQEILEKGGCLISEYAEGTEPEKYRYVQRDRLQGRLSEVMLSSDPHFPGILLQVCLPACNTALLCFSALRKSGSIHQILWP